MPRPTMTEPAQAAIAIGISVLFVIVCIVVAFSGTAWYFGHQPTRSPQSGGITIMVSLMTAFVSTAVSFFVYRLTMRVLHRLTGPTA